MLRPLNYATLFRQFILRAMWREKVRAAIVLAGISLGVAVMVAIHLANRSVTDSFRAAVDSVGGSATLRIRGSGGRFDELLLRDAYWLHQFGRVSPVIETYAMVAPGQDRSEPAAPRSDGQMLHVLGVDVLEDAGIRTYRLVRTSDQGSDPTPQELLRILTEPDAVVLTEKFARRAGKSIGDPIDLVFGSQRRTYFIRGLLRDEGPARAMDGNFVLMDIAAAQWAAGELGFLDHVDLKLNRDRDADEARQAIGRRLPAGLVIETPADSVGRAETMIDAFHFNLEALSGIALLVGLMLIYNSMSVSVAARRDEIGMLQAVGASRATVLGLFLGEAALLAVLGALLGLALGGFLARWAIAATTQTVETFYAAELASGADSLAIGRGEVLLALAVSLGVSLLAAALPAWRASRIQPLEVIRPAGEMQENARAPRRYFRWSLLLAILGWLATQARPVAERPVFGFIAQFLFSMAGVCLVPGILASICRFVRDRISPRMPRLEISLQLASSNLLSAVSRISTSIAALAVSLAMMVSISIMVGSFRETVVYWLHSTLHANLFVRPAMLTSSLMDVRIAPEAVARIRRDADVTATGWFYGRQVPYAGRTVRVAASDVKLLIEQGIFVFKSRADAATIVHEMAEPDNVLITESFSLLFGKQRGDRLLFPVGKGLHEFRVAAVYYDYSSNQGTLLMNGATYSQCFGEADPGLAPTSMSVYLRPGADAEAVRERLARSLGDQQLFISTNDNVRKEAMRIFDSTFTITYALEVIAILIAAMGVVATLITLIYERQREIALLSLVGATPGQIRGMVVIEALLIGVVSQLLGILIGLVLALVLIYVINVQSFAWTIQFHLPIVFLLQSTFVILATTVVCGLYPAARAAQIKAITVAREE
jgi:putative ABC transport system permease protein